MSNGMIPYDQVPAAEFDWLVDHVNSKLREPMPAEEILRYARDEFKSVNDLQAVLLFKIQDRYCTRCGECCRTSNPIDFTKPELKAVADHLHTSYKQLKKKLKAHPRGDGKIMVPGKPCPFLKGRNHCTIYDIRPAVCEYYPLGKGISQAIQGKGFEMPSSCEAVKTMMANIVLTHVLQEKLKGDLDDLNIELDQGFLDQLKEIKNLPKVTQFQMIYDALEVPTS